MNQFEIISNPGIWPDEIATVVSSTAAAFAIAAGIVFAILTTAYTFISISPAAVFVAPSAAGPRTVAAETSVLTKRVATGNAVIMTLGTFLVFGSKPIAKRGFSF